MNKNNPLPNFWKTKDNSKISCKEKIIILVKKTTWFVTSHCYIKAQVQIAGKCNTQAQIVGSVIVLIVKKKSI